MRFMKTNAVIILLLISALFISGCSTKEPITAGSDTTAVAGTSQELVMTTRNNIDLYASVLGTDTANGMLEVSDEFLDHIDSVSIMGRTGTIVHGMSNDISSVIDIMEWYDNSAATQDEFSDFITLLDGFWGAKGSVKDYPDMSRETYVWRDDAHNSFVACWFQDDRIQMRWMLDPELATGKQPTPAQNQENKAEDFEAMKADTDKVLDLYCALLGNETADGNMIVSDEFLETVNAVYIMGRRGTVIHGMTDVSPTQIRTMVWTDNFSSSVEEFDHFIDLLDQYWGQVSEVKSYSNMSPNTHVWRDYSHRSYVACWHNGDKICMQWDYDESLESLQEMTDRIDIVEQLGRPLDGSEGLDRDTIKNVIEDNQRPEPAIGMTAEEVLQSRWGKPADINKTIVKNHVSEQWVYDLGRYIYLDDGIVTAIQK